MATDYNYYRYTADNGTTHRVRTGADTALAQTTAAVEGGSYTSPISAQAGGNRRRLGLHVRGFRMKRSTGAGVARKSFSTFLPVFLATDYNAANLGAKITLNGVEWEISKKIGEAVN